MGVDGIDMMDDDEAAKATIAAVKKLSADVGIPADLKGILKDEDVHVPGRVRLRRRLPSRQSPRHQRGRDQGAVPQHDVSGGFPSVKSKTGQALANCRGLSLSKNPDRPPANSASLVRGKNAAA